MPRFFGQPYTLHRLDGNLLDGASLNIEHFYIMPHEELLGLLQFAGAIGDTGVGGSGITLFPDGVEIQG